MSRFCDKMKEKGSFGDLMEKKKKKRDEEEKWSGGLVEEQKWGRKGAATLLKSTPLSFCKFTKLSMPLSLSLQSAMWHCPWIKT